MTSHLRRVTLWTTLIISMSVFNATAYLRVGPGHFRTVLGVFDSFDCHAQGRAAWRASATDLSPYLTCPPSGSRALETCLPAAATRVKG